MKSHTFKNILFILSFILFFSSALANQNNQGAAVFLTHGGGPYPILEPSLHKQMYDKLQQISIKYPSPKAIIFISAHWQEKEWTILDNDNPSLYYDYYGFPDQAYNLSYKLESSHQLRQIVKKSIQNEGIKLKSNFQREYDHGVFIPMMLMYKDKNIPPVIQISIKRNLDPQQHYRFGKAFRQLKNSGFLIIGSGASSHGGFGSMSSMSKSEQFSKGLQRICMDEYDQDKILEQIKNWRQLKNSKQMHPRQQHLVPLFVILGVYEGKYKQEQQYVDELMKLNLRNYIFK